MAGSAAGFALGDFLCDFAVGSSAGVAAKTVTAPLERVRSEITSQNQSRRIRAGEVPRYHSMWNCIMRIYAEQVATTFWRGHLTNCLRYFPVQALSLSLKDSFKKLLRRHEPGQTFPVLVLENFVAGGVGAAGGLAVLHPLERARAEAGASGATLRGFLGSLRNSASGPRGLMGMYSGVGATASVIGCRGLQLGAFDTLAGVNPWEQDRGWKGKATTFVAAEAAIVLGAGAVHPLGVANQRLRAGERVLECLRRIAADEGVTALAKGLYPSLWRSVAPALVLAMYDRSRLSLGLRG